MAAPIPKIIPNQPRTPLTEPGGKPKKTQEILGCGFGTEPEVRLPKLQTETDRKWSEFHACHLRYGTETGFTCSTAESYPLTGFLGTLYWGNGRG